MRLRTFFWTSGSIIAATIAAPVAAQIPPSDVAASQTGVDDASAEIVVTGIRASIAQSLSDKRAADTVSDVITAEDIGKLPDNNVAETLSRVSGVQITRRDGDGSGFAVRGISQNRLELNGRTFIGPSASGDPALEALNPEILSGLEVIKSPSADLAEGALGAIVNLKTKRPLDLAAFVASGRFEGVYASQAKDLGYRGSALLSAKLLDDTLGVLVSGAYTDARTRGYLFDTVGWTRTSAIDVTGDGVADANQYRPNRLMQTIVDRRDRRLTLNGAIQYRPSPQLEMLVEATYSDLKRQRDLSQYQGLLNNAATGARADPDGTITSANFSGITLRPLVYDVPTSFSSYTLGGTVKWNTADERLTLTGDLSYSKGKGEDGNPGAPFAYVVVPRSGRVTNATYNLTGGSRYVPNFDYTGNYDLRDPSNYQLLSVFDGENPRNNSNLEGRADVDYVVDLGPLSKLEAGVRYTKTELFTGVYQNLPLAAAVLAGNDRDGNGILTVSELTGLNYDNSQSGTYFPGIIGSFPTNFLTGSVDKDAARAGLNLPALSLFANITSAPTSVKDVDETSWAAYAKASFAGPSYRGNLGLRYVRTDRVSSGYLSVTQPTRAENRFDFWLPSANFVWDISSDLLLRLAAAKVVARPNIQDVGPGFSPNTTNNTGTRGNPNLRPFEATQYDVTLEWYFSPASLMSVAAFRKDVNSFTIVTVTPEFIPGFSERFGLFNISQPQNGTAGRVQGFEINYQHAFRFLPGLLRNLGVQTNYTYADSKTPIIDDLTRERLPLPNLSRHSYSLIGYYDDGMFSTRLAYTHRSRSLAQIQQATSGGSRYTNAFGQLDASASYNITKNFRLTFEAQNLNKAIARNYDGTELRLSSSAMEEQRFYFGAGFTF